MGDSFSVCQETEMRALADLIAFFRLKAEDGRYVLTHKGALSEFLQTTVGDALLNCENGKVWSVEIKAEEKRMPNFYLETWSNYGQDRSKVGWMLTLWADVLLYYFLDVGDLYSIPFRRLRRWAFEDRGRNGHAGRIWDYPEKPQRKHAQLNLTKGRCVPIETIGREVGFTHYVKDGSGFAVSKDGKAPALLFS